MSASPRALLVTAACCALLSSRHSSARVLAAILPLQAALVDAMPVRESHSVRPTIHPAHPTKFGGTWQLAKGRAVAQAQKQLIFL